MFVLAEYDATLASYRTGQAEAWIGGRRTVERFERGDRRLRYHVAADGRFEPPGRWVGFPVMDTAAVVLMMIGGARALLNGGQTDRGSFAATDVVVVIVVVVGG